MTFIIGFIAGISMAYAQYDSGFYPQEHYPPTNDTKLTLIVMNSTEFKERTAGYNYTLAGVDYNWIPKENNYYDFGGVRVTFIVWGFDNGTVKGESFNLDSQLKIKSIFVYNADNPPSGYYSDRCEGCFIGTVNSTKPLVEPKNVVESPLKQFKSGIAAMNVVCADGLTLVIKAEDGSPACVKPTTANILIERGWGIANLSQTGNITNTKVNNPFGIVALVIYHPASGCLGPMSNTTTIGCSPNDFYLKIGSNSTAYLMGYNICDDNSCANNNNLSLLLPINTVLNPNYQLLGLPVNLQWKYGDAVHIQLEVSPDADNKTASLIDLGNSTIVH
jgi:hypothetical protein